ncbi:Type I restriction-modification system, specificity subunit S [Rhodovulum sp. PH10]|uniref:restriction endonuclease subunit S n=1 Tax=Rhodovulum sp. PH10 TaxID=1187851 RepID=UPI00027C27FB|nr:restriction endonuclease subunit S [Rhodovulum sp. PH10]EJW10755.1 Type I restriction-modification system, specificity subunit S [Rhodovulum sp. PH10]
MIEGLRPYPDMKPIGLAWLPEVPAHWDVRRNGRLFGIRKETGYPDLPILEVSLRTGVRVRDLENGTRKQQMTDRSKYQRAAKGDLAYNMMRMWQGAVGVVPTDGLVSPAYGVVRPREDTFAPYFAYLFRTAAYMREVETYSRGIVPDRNRLYWESFKQIASCVPPAEEQQLIVQFLDWHGAQTAKLIRSKKKLITLLNEQGQAVIHRAVTCGLAPGVEFKPSGTNWIGQIPASWEPVTLRRVIRRAVDGPHHSPDYHDEGVPFLSARNIKVDRWSLDDVKYISESDFIEFSRRVLPAVGDVLYTKGGTTGVARAVDLDFKFQVWVHVAVLKIIRSKMDPHYLAFLLNSPRCYEQSQLYTRGATNQDLGLGRMKEIVFAVPPRSEQDAILVFLRDATERITKAIDSINRETSLLIEFRTRLLADVVTGKLDVRDAAARLPEMEVETVQDLYEDDLEEVADEVDAEEAAA